MLSGINTPKATKNPKKMNTEEIRAEIRASVRRRRPANFDELYEETFSHLTGVFWWYDRNVLRQQVAMELLLNFRKKLTQQEIYKLEKIRRDSEKARQDEKFEMSNF